MWTRREVFNRPRGLQSLYHRRHLVESPICDVSLSAHWCCFDKFYKMVKLWPLHGVYILELDLYSHLRTPVSLLHLLPLLLTHAASLAGFEPLGRKGHAESAWHSSSRFQPLSSSVLELRPENQTLPMAVDRNPLVSKRNRLPEGLSSDHSEDGSKKQWLPPCSNWS